MLLRVIKLVTGYILEVQLVTRLNEYIVCSIVCQSYCIVLFDNLY